MSYVILGATFGVVVAILLMRYLIVFRGFLPGYRGAVGVKNRSAVRMMAVRIDGFARLIDVANIAAGGHSFSFVDRQPLPDAVDITWRTATDGVEQHVRISLSGIAHDLKDGEVFCVFTPERVWNVEWARTLRIDTL